MFAAFHAGSTWQLLRARQIGVCSDAPASDLLQDFRRLRADMHASRLFESSKLYYAWKVRLDPAAAAAAPFAQHNAPSRHLWLAVL